MTNEYKINKKSKWVYYYKLLLSTLILYIIVFIGYVFYKQMDDPYMIMKFFSGMLLSGWFLIFGLPLFLLYFNHKKYSSNVVLKLNGNTFQYENNNELIIFSLDNIKKIELWLTPPAYDNRIDWQYFGKYHFIKILTEKGEQINISCLVFDKVKEVFPEELIERRKKFFPLMKKNILIQ